MSAASRRVAIVVAQQPAQTISTPHLSALTINAWLGYHEWVVETLMVPLVVIMRQIRVVLHR
jgi:hypothetical protein